jgi:hypothetical protein
MMEIPELTATQLSIITETVNGTGAYSQMDPDRDLDTTEDYANWMRGVDNTNALVSLGFLEDITDKCQEALAQVTASMGRTFRVYEATKMAMQMFREGPDNKPN